MPVELEMVPGGGVLQLRGAEPYSLTSPTEITGSVDDVTGNVSGLELSTPQVVIERKITSPLKADVTIEATFNQVAPGVGVFDAEGNLTIEQQLAVDLHIEVVGEGQTTPLVIPGDCQAAPVNLTLTSTAPYDRDTQRVTVATDDFTVPAVTADPACDSVYIAPRINDELAGSGHALSLTLRGALPEIVAGTCPTTTALAVAPSGSSALGADVTLTATTATVASHQGCIDAATDGEVLSGTIDFFRGSSVIGSAVLDGSGQATFTTPSLPAGTQQLSARFRGNIPFIKSASAPVQHRVTTKPVVSTDLPHFMKFGTPTEFTYTVSNSQFGEDLDDVRVDITTKTFGPVPTLERWDGAAWQSVTVVDNGPVRFASLPVFDLAPGAERTERLRMSAVAPPSVPGQVEVTFEVKPNSAPLMPAPTPGALGQASVTVVMHDTERIPATISSLYDDPVSPHTVRQGETVTVNQLELLPSFAGFLPTGYFEFFLDGARQSVGTWPNTPRPGEERTRIPAASRGTNGSILIHLPAAIATGAHTITVRYSGDSVYLPSQVTWPFTVLPARGPSYQCFSEGAPAANFRVNVEAQANVPTSAWPGVLDLDELDIQLLTDKSVTTAYNLYGMFNDFGPTAIGETVPSGGSLEDIRFTFSGEGTGTATHLVQSNPYELFPWDTDIDRVLSFDGEEGATTIAGAVGEVVPVTLETVEIDLLAAGFVPYNVVCTPVDEPLLLGEVRVLGVDLTVNPSGSIRAGDEVTLTANTGNPTGTGVAEFLDGTTTIGVVPVSGGRAAMTTGDLDPGDHTLKVRYFPVFPGPTPPAPEPIQVSPDVALTVLPEFDCAAFAQEGNEAVVRLVYLELLGRCPDQAGFDYWTGRLDAGASPAVFARSISATPEAVGRVVDDAYRTVLGRAADAPGRAFWIERMRTGTGRYDQLLAELAASPEFWNLSGSTRSGFVTRVYERLLNRAPDAAGLEYWTDRLAAGVSRHALVISLANQPEPLGRLVTAAYDEILGRAPTGSEPSNASAFLRTTGDRSGLYAELIGTPEFFDRAQDFPNPED